MENEEKKYRTLPGLPPYGPMAISFPESFGRKGREGYVVEFLYGTPNSWVGNFAPGMFGYSGVHPYPNETDVLIFTHGAAYVVDPEKRSVKFGFDYAIARIWEVGAPRGFVCDRQGLAFLRLGAQGIEWHTRRISLDGFDQVILTPDLIKGLAYGIDGSWKPFEVDMRTGVSKGGNCPIELQRGWEKLSHVM